MDNALILFAAYIILVFLVLLKPLFKYLLGLRGVKVTYVNMEGKSSSKVVYFSMNDPLYESLKRKREV